MTTAAATRAAGIRVVGRAPRPRLVLPRMDVAGFVGFARPREADSREPDARVPVVIDSLEAFTRRFREVTVGRDAAGLPVAARLGPAVRAFFRNGGRRAVIVAVPVPADPRGFPGALLDPRLAGRSVDGLARAADGLAATDAPPRGIHALMRVEEVTIVAVPDAGLVPASTEPAVPRVGIPDTPPPADPAFADCATIPATHVQGLVPDQAQGLVHARWAPSPVAGDTYEVEARRPGHAAVRLVVADAGSPLVWEPGTALTVRVRVRRARDAGPWSAPAHVDAPAPGRTPGDDRTAALAAHRALVRMCAARGDCLAVLSAPAGSDTHGAVAYRAVLTVPLGEGVVEESWVQPLDRSEEHAWSHAVLIGPQLAMSALEEPAGLLQQADGAVCGVLAHVARTAGAWASPAGIPLVGVVGLGTRVPPVPPPTPVGGRLPAADPAEQAGVVLVRRAPHGYVMSLDRTLSVDPDLRHVGVRRLMHLLRRAALLHGTRWVFEPHGRALERAVQRGFEDLLAIMLDRGAFHGASARDAYRVEILTTPVDRDAGRMVVRLSVVPAHPVRWLDIRLAISGDGVQVEGGPG